ncbi:hypothetical protein F5B20DRAFT_167072 [Whalleya microplaca]|nr:hypothetical protein F5B20DRAFT_167072 [Whalleya microplaca]
MHIIYFNAAMTKNLRHILTHIEMCNTPSTPSKCAIGPASVRFTNCIYPDANSLILPTGPSRRRPSGFHLSPRHIPITYLHLQTQASQVSNTRRRITRSRQSHFVIDDNAQTTRWNLDSAACAVLYLPIYPGRLARRRSVRCSQTPPARLLALSTEKSSDGGMGGGGVTEVVAQKWPPARVCVCARAPSENYRGATCCISAACWGEAALARDRQTEGEREGGKEVRARPPGCSSLRVVAARAACAYVLLWSRVFVLRCTSEAQGAT